MQDSDRPRPATDRRPPALGGTVSQLRIARIPPAPQPDRAAGDGTPRIDSRTLFRDGRREVVIAHEGTEYRLRVTASGKLILTK